MSNVFGNTLIRIVQESLIGHGLTKMRVHNLILNFVAFDIYICNSLLQLYKLLMVVSLYVRLCICESVY